MESDKPKCPSCGSSRTIYSDYIDVSTAYYACCDCGNCFVPMSDTELVEEKRVTKLRFENRVKKYGLSSEDVDRMLKDQGNRCGICGLLFVKKGDHLDYHIDHDHHNGFVRGLLCPKCNKGLGLFRDNENVLGAACEWVSGGKSRARVLGLSVKDSMPLPLRWEDLLK